MWFRRIRRTERQRFRPQLEWLEGRCLPAVTITPGIFEFGNETIRIVSNNQADDIDIEDFGDGIDIYVNDVYRGFFGGPEFRTVEIFLKGGDDSLHIDLLEGLDAIDRSYIINTGSGNDEVLLHIQDEIEDQGQVTFLVVDGGGSDTLEFEIFEDEDVFNGSTVKLDAKMGGGSDFVTVLIDADIFNGSSVHINVDLGNGADFFGFAQSTFAEVEGSALDVSVRAGKGGDTVFASFNEDFDDYGNIQFNANLGAGHDLFTATFDSDEFDVNEGGGLDGAAFNLTVWGESGNDLILVGSDDAETMRVNATVFDIHIYGGAGNDEIDVDFARDGGSFTGVGGIVIFIDGGRGHDNLFLAVTCNDDDGNNVFDLTVFGNTGNDDVTFFGESVSGDPLFVGDGVLLDGGLGRDFREILDDTDFDRIKKNFEDGIGDFI